MAYHHLALYAQDMAAIHHFYEGVMGFELVKVEIAPIPSGGWGKHFFYRMDKDDGTFVAFWDLYDTPDQDHHEADLNRAANLPMGTNHFAFRVENVEALNRRRERWAAAGHDVLEIEHNWCHSIYTHDPNGNVIEFCLTTGTFSPDDRERALAALTERHASASPPPAKIKVWPVGTSKAADPAAN